MRKQWLALCDRFNALSSRERWISFVMLVSILLLLAYLLFLGPLLTKGERYQQQLKQNAKTLKSLQTQEQELTQLILQDPDAARHQQILELERSNQTRRSELAEFQTHLASPEQMPRLLGDLLGRESGLELVSIKTLKPENLFHAEEQEGTEAAATEQPERGVYRHGLEIAVRGNYAALSAYAHKVEQLPWRLYWGGLTLQVERYPLSVMSFTVYTVSMDKTWLSL